MTHQRDQVTRESMERSATEDAAYYSRQLLSALVPIISTTVTGMTMGFSAVLLPQLKVSSNVVWSRETESYVSNATFDDASSVIVRTIDEESWIAASAALAMAPGCWMSSLLIDNLGRKTSFLVINPIALIGWLIIAFAKTVGQLIVGRSLCGLCVGLLGATSPVYIAETSHPRLRGLLLAALSLAVAMGILFVQALGTWLDWRLAAYICAVIPIVCIALGIFIPESPNWLLSIGKREDALAAWTFLRGDHWMRDFWDLKTMHGVSPREHKCDTSETVFTKFSGWFVACKSRLTSKIFLMPLLIVCVFSFVSQFSGINVVTFYCVQMIQEVAGAEHGYLGTLILGLVRVFFGALACWLTRRYPRRILAMISGLGTCLTLISLSTCLYFDFGRPWLPIVLLFVYTGTIAIGLVPLPWLLCAELFNDNNRGLGSGLGAGFAFLCFFAVVKTGPLAFGALMPAGTFMLYGTVAFLGSAFLYSYLPETKDKTLRDIERDFTRETTLPRRCDGSAIATIS